MSFPRLTFPLTVDFCSAGYWIGDQGPFKYGAAVIAFFTDGDIAEVPNDGIPLLRELEQQLQTFGGPLNPYVREQPADINLLLWPEKAAVNCSMCFAFHSIVDGTMVMAERYVFPSLRDFLYVELGKSIAHGNAPRQCRLCGRWFLHEQGDRMMYCERIAPGEKSKTCREAGARVTFTGSIRRRVFLSFALYPVVLSFGNFGVEGIAYLVVTVVKAGTKYPDNNYSAEDCRRHDDKVFHHLLTLSLRLRLEETVNPRFPFLHRHRRWGLRV